MTSEVDTIDPSQSVPVSVYAKIRRNFTPAIDLVILPSARISHGDKKRSCSRGIMRLPENAKFPSEKQ